ncbi:hypothetical protein HZC31_07685 [Candidatus Woesearchaeota archaeon]|nr:hypothetical protein [Candidatus Woesearchaeota archaeon]
MEKYHPLYAYAIVSVVLILGIQMMLTDGTSGITGFAVGDQGGQGQPSGQQGGTPQGGGQQGQAQQGGQGQTGGQQRSQQGTAAQSSQRDGQQGNSQGSQGQTQQGTGTQEQTSGQKQGFFQKVGGFFGFGSDQQNNQQSGTEGQSQNQQQGTQEQTGQSPQGTQQQNGGQQQNPEMYDDGTDTDGDGLSDAEEEKLGTDAEDEDSDYEANSQKYQEGQSSGQVQELSEESKACLDAIDEKIKSCTEDEIQTCLDEDANVECIMKAIGSCMEKYKSEKESSCFEQKSD